MFSGMIRIFLSHWRSLLLRQDAIKKRRSSMVIFGLYKSLPLAMGCQVLLGAVVMTANAHIDHKHLPGFFQLSAKSFFYTTALYMCVVIACDWTETSGFWVSVYKDLLENCILKSR